MNIELDEVGEQDFSDETIELAAGAGIGDQYSLGAVVFFRGYC